MSSWWTVAAEKWGLFPRMLISLSVFEGNYLICEGDQRRCLSQAGRLLLKLFLVALQSMAEEDVIDLPGAVHPRVVYGAKHLVPILEKLFQGGNAPILYP
jgi:hypothetical protein